jgi:hypothetical protein
MQGQRAIDAAKGFLDVLWAGVPPTDTALAAAVDRLLAASHDVSPSDGMDSDLDPPTEDWSSLYTQIAARFPDYGLYAVAEPLVLGECVVMAGDAIDDLADLTKDLREVLWRSEHIGVDDGAWYFRLMYFHWAHHARQLALFLHARLMSRHEA